MFGMPGRSFHGPLPEMTEDETELRGRLEFHVRTLAGDIGERNVLTPNALARAEEYIRRVFDGSGYLVAEQTYDIPLEPSLTVRNIEVEISGTAAPGDIVIIGAHYDTVPGCAGANDNTTGIAGVLELARLLSGRTMDRTVRLVAFVNEEPPFFRTDLMGSRVYARRCRERDENVVAMLSLETIGFYADEPGSQKYPFPFSQFYPDTGNFIGFVGNLGSGSLTRRAIRAFRESTEFPSEGIAAPAWIPGIGWSDHWSFWREGYPGVMITDTAPFRYPHYHTPQDTPDRIDYDRFTRVVMGVARVVEVLANSTPAPTEGRRSRRSTRGWRVA